MNPLQVRMRALLSKMEARTHIPPSPRDMQVMAAEMRALILLESQQRQPIVQHRTGNVFPLPVRAERRADA